MEKIIKNKKGVILLLTMFILFGILVVTLAAADLVLAGIRMNRLTGYSIIAIFASEAGIERSLWEARQNPAFSLPDYDDDDLFSDNLDNGSSYVINYSSSTPNVTFKSIGSYSGAKRSVQSTFSVGGGAVPPPVCGSYTVQDADGNMYNTVLVGSQCWMASALNVGIKLATGADMPGNNGIIEKWCYGNLDANCTADGGLYPWNEAMQYSTTEGARGICPADWHIPTENEQQILAAFLTDIPYTCNPSRTGWDCEPAGTKLLLGGSSGLNFLSAGNRNSAGSFLELGISSDIWSSTQFGVTEAWFQSVHEGDVEVNRNNFPKSSGFSIRCLKD
ncbi:MAG: FISUMP domain-containing protein [Candidatus Margulisiibacteriota bacterium]